MTLHQALVRLDELSHNTYSAAQKTAWLSQLDGRVSEKILASCRDSSADNTQTKNKARAVPKPPAPSE